MRRSAIFRGGWTLEAADAICADERLGDADVIDLLAALVDKSLVVVEDDGEDRRYRLLESTRQFAAERLAEARERENVAALHCNYFAETRAWGERCLLANRFRYVGGPGAQRP